MKSKLAKVYSKENLLNLNDFDVSPRTGFLPRDPPLARLTQAYYEPWENVMSNLHSLIISRRLEHILIRELPILSTEFLSTEAEWRRAYVILIFLAHSLIWGGNRPVDTVPPSISVPLLHVCDHLELPPVATYAGLVLWNWKPIFAHEPHDNLRNLMTQFTFTGSSDESWFFLISVAIEARGGPMISLMLEAMQAIHENEDAVEAIVTSSLQTFAQRIDEIATILTYTYENCNSHIFFHRIRPFLAGSKNMSDAGLPHGVKYDCGTGREIEYKQFSGGSNAQSSLIQFFDIVLGIDHRPTGFGKKDKPMNANPIPNKESNGKFLITNSFIQEMRKYMPGGHRRFLERVSQIANIRSFVEARKANKELSLAYDSCLKTLCRMRDEHIRLVTRYIVVKSREKYSVVQMNMLGQVNQSTGNSDNSDASSSDDNSLLIDPENSLGNQKSNVVGDSLTNKLKRFFFAEKSVNNLFHNQARYDNSSTNDKTSENIISNSLRGTGGSMLIPFLKQARDETIEPVINSSPLPSRPSMGNVKTSNITPEDSTGLRCLNKSTYVKHFTDDLSSLFSTPPVDSDRISSLVKRRFPVPNSKREIAGLAGTWTLDHCEGGICHW